MSQVQTWFGAVATRRGGSRCGVPSLWAALGHFVGVVQHPIHRADRTQIPPLLQQGGVHRRRGSVQEPIFVERVPTPACVPVAPTHTATVGATNALSARAISGADKPRHELHPTPGTPEPGQRWEPAFPRPLSFVVGVRRPVQGDPQQLGGFFLDIEDRLRLLEPLPQPGVLFAQLLVLDSHRIATHDPSGPVAWPVPSATPSRRARRHSVRCEEYSPSRRSNAAIWPGSWHPSASFRIPSLYSALNCRRLAFSGTSGSGRDAAVEGPSAPLRALHRHRHLLSPAVVGTHHLELSSPPCKLQ